MAMGLKVKLMINCINVKLSAQQILKLKQLNFILAQKTEDSFVLSRGSRIELFAIRMYWIVEKYQAGYCACKEII